MSTSRRAFLQDLTMKGLSLPLLLSPLGGWAIPSDEDALQVHIFSKHLQFLEVGAAAEMAAEMGFAGLDLTVRPKGHVLPASVLEDLPQAIGAIEAAGSKVQMITTAIESIDRAADRNVLSAASQSGVQYYRSNWFPYQEGQTMPESLAFWQAEINKLGTFNQARNIIGCYQNHAGTKIGASYWEIQQLLASVDPRFFGVQYDIRHAVVEGGLSWENGINLLRQQIKTIVLKDFKWGQVDGHWKPINVPIGQGMVNFKKYFRLLKAYQINVPVSLHLEYPLGGAEKGHYEITVDKKVVFDAMRQDLQTIQRLWRAA